MAYCHAMAQESESRNLDKVIVRLPDGMRDRIKAAAEAANRSMNAEIVATLEERYPPLFVDVELSTMTEWFNYIDNATTPEDRLDRLHDINSQLKFSATKHVFEIKIFEVGDEAGQLYMTMSSTHPANDKDRPIRTAVRPPLGD